MLMLNDLAEAMKALDGKKIVLVVMAPGECALQVNL